MDENVEEVIKSVLLPDLPFSSICVLLPLLLVLDPRRRTSPERSGAEHAESERASESTFGVGAALVPNRTNKRRNGRTNERAREPFRSLKIKN